MFVYEGLKGIKYLYKWKKLSGTDIPDWFPVLPGSTVPILYLSKIYLGKKEAALATV